MNKSSEKIERISLYDPLLPLCKLNSTHVFPTGAMLQEELRPKVVQTNKVNASTQFLTCKNLIEDKCMQCLHRRLNDVRIACCYSYSELIGSWLFVNIPIT